MDKAEIEARVRKVLAEQLGNPHSGGRQAPKAKAKNAHRRR